MLHPDAAVNRGTVLDQANAALRRLQEAGLEPRFLVAGPDAYEHLRHAMAERFGRSAGYFEQYGWLTIVVDPQRADRLAVLPAPRETLDHLDPTPSPKQS
jgi:hypothetical protein